MEGPLVISNTTPIINFAEIGRIELLDALFGAVVIPPAVEREVLAKANPFQLAAQEVQGGRFPVVSSSDDLLLKALSASVHPGEAACIALAMERPGSLPLG